MKISVFLDNLLEMTRQRGCSLDEALKEAKKCGIDYVDVHYGYGNFEELKKLLCKYEMKVGGMYVFIDLAHKKEEELQKSAVEKAFCLGADSLLVIPGLDNLPGDDRKTVLENIIEGLNSICEIAETKKLNICIEDFGAAVGLYGTPEEMLYLIENVKGLKCCFDTGNFSFHKADAIKAFDILKEHICHVHIKDWLYSPLMNEKPAITPHGLKLYPSPAGYGVVPLAEIMKGLCEMNYDGVISIEQYDAGDALSYLKKGSEWLIKNITTD